MATGVQEQFKDIKWGLGLGIIKFGMTREEVSDLLGQPDEIEKEAPEDADESNTETWHYDDLDISLNFDERENWKLLTISVTSEDYRLNGHPLIGEDFNTVISLLKELEFNDIELEEVDPDESPDSKLVVSEEFGINFWFEGDVLTEIQWEPIYLNEDTIHWPK